MSEIRLRAYDPSEHVILRKYTDPEEAAAAFSIADDFPLFSDHGGAVAVLSENQAPKGFYKDHRHVLVIKKGAQKYSTTWSKMSQAITDFMKGYGAGRKAAVRDMRQSPRWDLVFEYHKASEVEETNETVLFEDREGGTHRLERVHSEERVYNDDLGYYDYIDRVNWVGYPLTTPDGRKAYVPWSKRITLSEKVKGYRSAIKAYFKALEEQSDDE